MGHSGKASGAPSGTKTAGRVGGVNVAVVAGRLARPAAVRVLPSGATLVALEVTVASGGGRAETVPVVWPDAPAGASTLDAGEGVVVVGRVRRRFFRAGGATMSRTEVVAQRVVPARLERRVRTAVEGARTVLERWLVEVPAGCVCGASGRAGARGARISR